MHIARPCLVSSHPTLVCSAACIGIETWYPHCDSANSMRLTEPCHATRLFSHMAVTSGIVRTNPGLRTGFTKQISHYSTRANPLALHCSVAQTITSPICNAAIHMISEYSGSPPATAEP